MLRAACAAWRGEAQEEEKRTSEYLATTVHAASSCTRDAPALPSFCSVPLAERLSKKPNHSRTVFHQLFLLAHSCILRLPSPRCPLARYFAAAPSRRAATLLLFDSFTIYLHRHPLYLASSRFLTLPFAFLSFPFPFHFLHVNAIPIRSSALFRPEFMGDYGLRLAKPHRIIIRAAPMS